MLILTEDYTCIEFNNSVTYVRGIRIRLYMLCICVCMYVCVCVCTRARVYSYSFFRVRKKYKRYKSLFLFCKQTLLSQPNYTAIINFLFVENARLFERDIARE